MLEHYAGIAESLGGKAIAKYRNGICLVLSNQEVLEYDGEDIASESFIISAQPHPQRVSGLPLDSLSIDIETGCYYLDLRQQQEDSTSSSNGFRDFFARTILTAV